MTYDEFDKVRRILHQSFIDAEANIFKRLDKLGNFRFDESTARDIVRRILIAHRSKAADELSKLYQE